jgi:hypothetical protein
MALSNDNAVREREDVLKRIGKVRARHTVLSAFTGLANLVTGLIVATVALVGLESAAYLAPTHKTIVLLLLGSLALLVTAWTVVKPIARPPAYLDIARTIESSIDGLHQHLTNAVQLWSQRNQTGASRALIDAAIVQASETTRTLDLRDAIDTTAPKASARRLALVMVVGLIALQLLPGNGVDALSRLADPTGLYVRPQETQLTIVPGDTAIIAGDSLVLVAEMGGLVPLKAVFLRQEEGKDTWTAIERPVREDRAEHVIPSVRKSFLYRWEAHDATSQPYHVLAKPRPVVLSLTTSYNYPVYTGLPERIDQEGGDIAALSGTDVTLQVRASRTLSQAWLTFEDGTHVEATVTQDSLTASFQVEHPARFTIGLRDTAGIENADPVTYRVLPLEDEPPTIIALRPGADSALGEQMLVPLMFEATDDFGVANVEIAYTINRDGEAHTLPLELETPQAREMTQSAIWDLSRSNLLPGDQVAYRLRAYDINTMSGPGMGETPEYVVRFPSLQEIHEAARRSQDETVEQLEEIAEQSQRLQEKMENVAREIVKNEEATWEDRAEIREALKQQEALQQEIEEGVRALDETRQRMEQSGLLSPETVEKIEQVRSLMESLNSPELDQITQDLQGAVDEIDPEMIQEAIERLTSEQEKFQENLDRTIALLKRVRDEQMLDALTARLQDLAEDQRTIHDALSLAETPTESQVERQTVQTREADHLTSALKEAAQSIDTPDDRLQDLAQAYQDAQISQRSEQSTRDMKAGQRKRANEGTEQLAQDLEQMADDLAGIRDAYRQVQKDELLEQLAGIFRDALNLSRSQEATSTEAEQQGNRPDQEQLGRRQTRDLNAASRLAQRIQETSSQSFLIPPQAGAGLQNAMKQMQNTMGNLQRGLGSQAGKNAREAMAGLNSSASAIREAMAAVKASGSGTGLDEMLQQLSEASDRQSDLNAQTEGMMGQPRPGGSTGGGLPQMSAEQEAIRQMLNQIREKFGAQEGEALGDLGKVAEDMEDVARRLGRNQLDSPTINRQRRILSRMLDAQRSIRQRGFSNDREAQTGEDVAYRGPGSLPSTLGESSNPLRARLREALRQGYPDEYQSLIRKYFDRLIEDAGASGSTP